MKILISEEQLKKIIRAEEAYSNEGSLLTIINGKRDVGFFVAIDITKKLLDLIRENHLKMMYVKGNPNDAFIIYRQGSELQALELKELAEKYGGYLAYNATEEDSRRIGQLLSYHPDDIEDYIKHTH